MTKNSININELMEISKIDKNKEPKYVSFEEAMNKLNNLIKENYIEKNYNYGIVYINDDLIKILYDNLEQKNFISYNLFDSFNDYYHKKYDNLNKILSELNLKPNTNTSPCTKELKSMTRIINKMVKEGKIFYVPELTKVEIKGNAPINKEDNNLNKNSNISTGMKIENNFATDAQSDNNKLNPDIPNYFIRFKNFPSYINKIDIKDLLYQYEINENDIVLSYDIFGKKTGGAIVRLYNLEEYKEIFSCFNFYFFNDKYIIELFDSNIQEFEICSRSTQFINKKIRNKHLNIFMKISKIPKTSTENDLKNLFNNCSIVENGIKFNRNSTQGEAIIVFETEAECFEALQKNNGRLLKNQSILLKESNLNEYEEFASTMAFEKWLPILSELIVPDDVKRSLYLMGLPLDCTKNQILKFLAKFNVDHSDLVVNDEILNNYGSIIVKFYNEDISNEAKEWIKFNKFKDKIIYVENLLSVVNKGNTMT